MTFRINFVLFLVQDLTVDCISVFKFLKSSFYMRENTLSTHKFIVVQQPKCDLSHLIAEVSRLQKSHTHMHTNTHCRTPLNE
jgi:hypothetical protein